MRRHVIALCLVMLLGLCAAPSRAAGDWSISGAQPHFARLNGHKVHYRSMGSGPQTLVLVHGWACDHTFWHLCAPALAKKHRVLLVDLIGHGLSSKPKLVYGQDLFAKSLKAVLDHAGVQGAVLIGHSMGTPVSIQTARLYPKLIKALVMLDGAMLMIPKGAEAEKKYLAALREWTKPFRETDPGIYSQSVVKFVKSMFGPKLSKETGRKIMAKIKATPMYVSQSATLNLFKLDDLKFWRFKPMNLPVLAIYAKQPEINAEFVAYLKKIFPRLELRVLDGVGHFFILERSGDVNRRVLDFAGKLP